MLKPVFVISSPFDTYSGYGARARDVIKAIIETDKYEVKLLSQKWGSTSFGFCEDHPKWGFLYNHKINNLTQKPDIWAQITIPNEFQPVGKYNIGITAGIESTSCPGPWIEGLNKMDLNLVSSKHSKKVFEEAVFEKREKQSNNLIGTLKVEKPIEVLFEGVDLNVYKKLNKKNIKNIDLNGIKENFCYLFVGHWLQGEIGHDRKNVGLLIKAFYEVFKNSPKKPALILKTSVGVSSYMSREEVLNRIQKIKKSINSKDLPNIYLLHGEFTDEDMNELYNHPKIKSMVSLTKGEGYGRPLLEFSTLGKPIIATNWSGHTDFLIGKYNPLIGGKLEPVHSSAANDWIVKESQWFSPESSHIGFFLKDVFEKYSKYKSNSHYQSNHSKNNFNWLKMKKLLDNLLDKNIPEFPKQVELNLPKLNLPKLEKIK